jgi:translation initiation factor IF-2
MGKIRVQDLAKKMGIGNQDLLFKLRSIGVRVEGDDANIDTDIIAAILQGKSLPNPREVILRDEQAKTTAPPPRRRPTPAGRRMPPNPLRPKRTRSIIQKVEAKIPTLPSSAPPKPTPVPAPTATAAAATTPAEQPPPQVTSPAAPATPAARAASSPAPVTASEEAQRESKKPKKGAKKAVSAPRPRANDEADLSAFKGSVSELEEAQSANRDANRAASRRKRRTQRKQEVAQATAQRGQVLHFKEAKPEGPVMISEGMTVRDFAEKLGVKSKDLIKTLFQRGIMANINHMLEPSLAQELAAEMGVETMVVSFEEEVQFNQELTGTDGTTGNTPRSPVVTVMGHVDHGKTSLLDAIRSSDVAGGESGGITQHIGAYRVVAQNRSIVFLDTPGHEAFTMMRSRGAKATDIVILMVAADDGVMPQTIEAIDHARAAGVPIVVAINKIDKDNANPEKVKKQLADHNLLVEDWGGETVAVPVSAIKREGIEELLEMVLITADLLELKATPELPAQGVVLEARKDVGRGIVATVLVQDGTLNVGDYFVAGAALGRVRAMLDEHGGRLEDAGPAMPVEVTGFDEVPEAGDLFQVVEDENKARSIASHRRQEQRRREMMPTAGAVTLEQLFDKIQEGEIKELPIVLKADVQGSVEVLRDALEKLSTEKVRVRTILTGVGAISTNDVILALASGAVIVGFNVRPERNAAEMADKEGVDVRLHTVIYELTDEVTKAMTGLLEPEYKEVTKGSAEVREIFKVPKAGVVAGCHVVEGVIPRNAQARLLRDNVVVYDGKLASLRRFKEDTAEVRSGFDCGISLDRYQDYKPGDVIEAYVREEVAATL